MYEKFGQFIDGKWQQSSSGETYEVINPATEEIIGKASKANSKDIQRALKSAEKGLEIWRNTPPWERSKVIRRISELMRKKVETLSKWLTLEVGKPFSKSYYFFAFHETFIYQRKLQGLFLASIFASSNARFNE